MMTPISGFRRGPYGEILPPPLVGGIGPDEALNRLVQAAERSGNPLTAMPKRGQSRAGMYNLAVLHVHQANLARAIAGDIADPAAVALRQLVIGGQELLSLRPLGMESLSFTTFAPVLQLMDAPTGTWRVGLPGHGRTACLQAGPDTVIKRTQHIYVEWSTAEDERWQGWVQGAIRRVKPNYQHLVWRSQLVTGEDLLAHLADGYELQRLGKHTTYCLITPKGQRIFEAGSLPRALRIADAFLNNQGAGLPDYPPVRVVEALRALGADKPGTPRSGVWPIGESIRARRMDANTVGLKSGDRQFGLQLLDGTHLTLTELMPRKKGRKLGDVLIPGHWSQEDKTRVGLIWASWVIGQHPRGARRRK